MERVAAELEAVAAAAKVAQETQQSELVDLRLAWSAVGSADTILY